MSMYKKIEGTANFLLEPSLAKPEIGRLVEAIPSGAESKGLLGSKSPATSNFPFFSQKYRVFRFT